MSTTKRHILLVEDDDAFRETLEAQLERQNYKVTAAAHGRTAQQVLGSEKIDVVISDINMPGVTGTELMHYVHRTHPEIPVILMTGFALLPETKDAFERGARAFISKPFAASELYDIISKCFVPEGTPGYDENDRDFEFSTLAIDDFILGLDIKFDIYIRLSSQKYLRVANHGENVPRERIAAYKARGIGQLYMKKEDFGRYMGCNLKLRAPIRAQSPAAKARRRSFLERTRDLILESRAAGGSEVASFERAKTAVESMVTLLAEQDEILDLLCRMDTHVDGLYAHSLAVSVCSVLLARAVKWTSATSVYKVAMGGLFHSVGMTELAPSVITKLRRELSGPEISTYETYPSLGVKLLSPISSLPSDVAQIVMQHRENCLGLGYPIGLQKNRIHPMARLVAVADEFCALALPSLDSDGMSPERAIQRMVLSHAERLDLTYLTALMNVCHVPPPEYLRPALRSAG